MSVTGMLEKCSCNFGMHPSPCCFLYSRSKKHDYCFSSVSISKNSRGEQVRGEIFNKSVFDRVVSSFIFIRR